MLIHKRMQPIHCEFLEFFASGSQIASFTPVLSHNHKDVEEHRRGMNEETHRFLMSSYSGPPIRLSPPPLNWHGAVLHDILALFHSFFPQVELACPS